MWVYCWLSLHRHQSKILGPAPTAFGPLPWKFPLFCHRRYVTKPTSDEEDDGDEKGKGEKVNKGEGLYMYPMA